MSADEGTRRHRPFLSSIGMHSALGGNFSMSTLTSTPLEMHAPRIKTKSLDLRLEKVLHGRKAIAFRDTPPPFTPIEVVSDDEDAKGKRRRSEWADKRRLKR